MSARLSAFLAAAELPVVIAIAPALLFPTFARLSVLLVVPVLWLCNRTARGHLIPPTPLNASLLVLLGAVGISVLATYDLVYSLGKISGVVLGVLLFWAVARWTTTPSRFEAASTAFVFAGAGLAIVGLLGTNWVNNFPGFGAVADRLPKLIRGLPGAEEGFQPNAVAGCLVLFVPLQIALLAAGARGTSGRRTWLGASQIFLLALTLGTLILTQSRGAWAGLFAATLLFLACYSRLTRIAAAVLAGGAAIFGFTLGQERLLDLAISNAGRGMAADVVSRVELWSRALYVIEDFPLTGVGMNVFRRILPALYPTFLNSPDIDVAHAHNHLLQAALDLGIPGLVAYGAIWLTAAVLLVQISRHSPDRTARMLACGLGAGLLAHFVFSMTDTIPLGAKTGLPFWLALALTAALHRVALSRPFEAPPAT